jgi:hypothetical protein
MRDPFVRKRRRIYVIIRGASGTAGIIKTVLSIESGMILPNMHFEEGQ